MKRLFLALSFVFTILLLLLNTNSAYAAKSLANYNENPHLSDSLDYDVVMFWGYPGETTSIVDIQTVTLQLYLSSKYVIHKDDLVLYKNEETYKIKTGAFTGGSLIQRDSKERYDYKLTRQINLIEGENKIKIVFKKDDYQTESRTITIIYDMGKPNLHFVGIGINEYTELDGPDDLQFAAKDVLDIADKLKEQEGKLYNNVKCHLMVNSNSTRKNDISSKLDQFITTRVKKSIKENDVLMLYVSSHSLIKDSNLKILPSDYQSVKNDDAFLLDLEDDIITRLRYSGINTIFVFVDICLNNATPKDVNFGYPKTKFIPDNPSIDSLLNKRLRIIPIISSSPKEASWEHPDWENSAFAKAMLEALNNEKVSTTNGSMQANTEKNNDKILSISELYYFLQARVPYLVKEKFNMQQTPYMSENALERIRRIDFPFFLLDDKE